MPSSDSGIPIYGQSYDGLWHRIVSPHRWFDMDTVCGMRSVPAHNFFAGTNHIPRSWCGLCAEKLRAGSTERKREDAEKLNELRSLLVEVRPLVQETFLAAGPMTERYWEAILARIDTALASRPLRES